MYGRCHVYRNYNHVRHRLSLLGRSMRQLRMANGNVVSPLGCWKGTVELNSTTMEGSFKVFDSGGRWDFLFRKRLMTAFAAVHDYDTDKVFIPRHQLTLRNQHDITIQQRHQASCKPHVRYKEEEHSMERTVTAMSLQVENKRSKHHKSKTRKLRGGHY